MAAYQTTDFDVDIKIGEFQFPLGHGEFPGIIVNSSVRFALPEATIMLQDPYNSVGQEFEVTHGQKIQVDVVDKRTDKKKTYKLRVFDVKGSTEGNTRTYVWNCYWDAPKFLMDVYMGSIGESSKKTSYEALAILSKWAGLKFEGRHSTNDSQFWYPSNRRACNFARYIVANAYRDEKSLMQFGVNLEGRLKYVDYNSIQFPGKYKFILGGGSTEDEYEITAYRPLSNSGFANAYSGYKHKMIHQSIFSYPPEEYKKIKTRKIADVIMRGEEVSGMLENGRIDYTPIDAGNVHENFFKAKYKNFRAAMLQSYALEVLVRQPTDVELLDPCSCLITGATKGVNDDIGLEYDMLNGNYIVTNKTISFEKNNYTEKFHLLRDGIAK